MAQTPSSMLPLGTLAPHFSLTDVVSGSKFKLSKGDKGTLIMFICNHCPYVKHVLDELVNIGNKYISLGISILAISSNDAMKYPEDGPSEMRALAVEKMFPFPYLYDEDQSVAKAYEAACTPDFYLFDEDLKLVYRGQLDESRPKNYIPVTGRDIRNALDNLLAGREIYVEQIPSIGCNIKWK